MTDEQMLMAGLGGAAFLGGLAYMGYNAYKQAKEIQAAGASLHATTMSLNDSGSQFQMLRLEMRSKKR